MTARRSLLTWLLVAVLSVTGLLPAAGMAHEHAAHGSMMAPADGNAPPVSLLDCIQQLHCPASGWLDTSFRASTRVAPGLQDYRPELNTAGIPSWVPDPVHPPPRLS